MADKHHSIEFVCSHWRIYKVCPFSHQTVKLGQRKPKHIPSAKTSSCASFASSSSSLSYWHLFNQRHHMLTHVAPRERVVLVKAAATSVSPPTLTATRTITCMSLRHLHRAGIFVRDAIPVPWMLYITIDWWTRFFSWQMTEESNKDSNWTAIGQQNCMCGLCD